MLSYTTPQPSHARRRALLLLGILCQTHGLFLQCPAVKAASPSTEAVKDKPCHINPKHTLKGWEELKAKLIICPLGIMVGLWLMFSNTEERTLAIAFLKPNAVHNQDDITKTMASHGFKVVQQKTFQFTQEEAQKLSRKDGGKRFLNALQNKRTSGNVIVMVLEKKDAVNAWRTLINPAHTNKAQENDPTSPYVQLRTRLQANVFYGAQSIDHAQKEIKLVFG